MNERSFTEARTEALRRLGTRGRHTRGNAFASAIVGVGRGPKETGGKLGDPKTSDCIRFYVSAKAAPGVLDRTHESFIPAELNGVPTDVVEVGRVRPFSSNVSPGAFVTLPDHSDVAPGDFGALGALVRETATGALGLITCNHVIAWNGRVPVGSKIHVACRDQFVTDEALALAELANWIPLQSDADNIADCAYATFETDFGKDGRWAQSFGKLNPVSGQVGDPAIGDKVVRAGGEVEGIVADVSATIDVDYEFGTYRLTNQIVIRTDVRTSADQPRFASEGASGSIVLRDDGNARVPIAMVWGGRRNVTYASPLKTCLEGLRLTWEAAN